MEPEKKKTRIADDNPKEEGFKSIKSESSQETLHPNKWNYVVDLELLKVKLAQTIDQERQRIRSHINACLTEITNIHDSKPHASNSNHAEFNNLLMNVDGAQNGSVSDSHLISPTLIKQVIMLMSQWYRQRVIQDTGSKNTSSNLKPMQQPHADSSNALGSQSTWMGVSRAEIEMVWSSFTRSFENGFQITEREHPLYNDTILDIVFAHLPPVSWLTCRLVNQQWNSNAVRLIRKNHHPALILWPDGVRKFCSSTPPSTGLFPLSKVSFSIYSPRNDSFMFFTNYGSYLKKLTFHIEQWQVPDDPISLNQVFRHMLRNVPQLESLEFLGDGPRSLSYSTEFVLNKNELVQYQLPKVNSLTLSWFTISPECVDSLFSLLPNVRSLEINLDLHKNETFNNVFNPITAALPKLRLTKFSLQLPVPNQQGPPKMIPSTFWKELGNQKLRILKIHLWGEEVTEAATFQSLLQTLSNTLEILTIISCSESSELSAIPIVFPQMKQLQRIEVISGNVQQICLPDPSQFPKLRSLCATTDSLLSIFGDNQPWEQVEELEVHNSIVCPFDHLPFFFPNLRKLVHRDYVYATAEKVSLIAKLFPRLEVLELFVMKRNISSTLTGLTVSNVNMLVPMLGQAFQEDMFSRIDTTDSFLLRLTKLRRLKLHILPTSDNHKESPCVIGVIAVHLALLRMKPLLELTIIGDFEIANDLVTKLTAHHRNVFLRQAPTPSLSKALQFCNFS